MLKDVFKGPGHIPAAIVATATGIATNSALVAAGTYVGFRAIGKAMSTPKEDNTPKRTRIEKQENPDLLNKHQFK